MIAEPLKKNLRELNIDHTQAQEQLLQRAAQQANNYISLINSHVNLHGQTDDKSTTDILKLMQNVENWTTADPLQR